MPVEFINKMASDLIRMCDSIDNHGLVDYQYGVAEEQILDSTSTKDPAPPKRGTNNLPLVVITCTDLMEQGN